MPKKATKPKKMGRPSKYESAMCDRAIEMMSRGLAMCQVAAKLGIAWATLQNWQQAHPEFLAAIKEGEKRSEAWWMELGRRMAMGKLAGNPTTWIFNMKNRFGWVDKHESNVTQTNQTTIKLETVQAVVKNTALREQLIDAINKSGRN